MTLRCVAGLLVLTCCGCSAIPAGGDPTHDPALRALAAAAAERPSLDRLAVAPIPPLRLASDESAKGWDLQATREIDSEAIGEDVLRALQFTGAYSNVRFVGVASLADAWRAEDDHLLTLEVPELRTTFDGRNSLWVPNILNWLWWIAPAWWVATEEYSLSLATTLTLKSVDSGQTIAQETIEVESSGTFDEFDRGWHFFGVLFTPHDPERWQRIARRLFPEAQRLLSIQVAEATDRLLRAATSDPGYQQLSRKAMVLAAGVERYADDMRLPPLAFAASDARAMVDALGALGVRAEHSKLLVDREATVPELRQAIGSMLGRANPGDSVIVYLAGYGTRGEDGAPRLLLHDAQANGSGSISLDELSRMLAAVKGEVLVVIDGAFEGPSRAVPGGERGVWDDLAPFRGRGQAALLACGPGQPALAPAHLEHGLLTFHLLRTLRGSGDANRDGRLTGAELFDFVAKPVVDEAALAGANQDPRWFMPEQSAFQLDLERGQEVGRPK
jgi:hypothetical protein